MATRQRQAELVLHINLLKKEGYKGLSIRKIADNANVSIGLINHHFGSLEKLVSISYESMAGEILASLKDACAAQQDDPFKRLEVLSRRVLISPSWIQICLMHGLFSGV